MLLVAVEDRDVRIEVGTGYGNSQNRNMEEVVREHLLPHFRQEQYSEGIARATGAIISKLTGRWPADIDSSRLKLQPEQVVSSRSESNIDWGTVFLIIFLIVGTIVWSKIAKELGFNTSGSGYDDDDWGSTSSSSSWSNSSSSSSWSNSSSPSSSSSSGGSSSGGSSSGGGASGSW